MSLIATSVAGSPDNIYYNARLSATAAADTTAAPTPVSFYDNRPAPLINKANDYRLSIVRFTTTLQSLPALIVEHPVGATTATAYSFTIVTGGNAFTGVVQWTPANASLTPGSGDLSDPYWYEYDFTRFGRLVNTCLSTITTDAGLTDAPFFQYDVAAATWSLYAPQEFNEDGGTAVLYADTQSHYLFSGFPVETSSTTDREYRYLCFLQPGESVVTVGGVDYLVRQQIPGSLTNWNPVRRFVFTTQTLPIVSESIVTAGYGNPLASQQIVSDLTPSIVRGDELRSGTLEYQPTAQ